MANFGESSYSPATGSAVFVDEAASAHAVERLSRIELLQQLGRIVSSKYFRNSKRYPVLLTFVVEQTLAGHADMLKERTLGITVFDRDSDYDTNADPIVRVTAGEVRKRIAQYYQEPGHDHEWRIYLPLGSYAPRFLFPTDEAATAAAEWIDPPESLVAPFVAPLDAHWSADATFAPVGFSPKIRWVHWKTLLLLMAASILAAVALPALKPRFSQDHTVNTAAMSFWKPLLSSRSPVLIVLGVHSIDRNGNEMPVLPGGSTNQAPPKDMMAAMVRSNMVPLSDLIAYSRVTDLLTQRSQLYRTQGSNQSTLEEMRRSPVLLIGGLDNAWTLRLQSALRYRFLARSNLCGEIVDGQHPATFWRFDNTQPITGNSRDYAIVANYFDRSLAQRVLIAAGIGMAGTKAAAEFVTSNDELQGWMNEAKPDQQNVEIVLSTEILDGQPGPPHILATATW